jgi:hypothetical protein
MEFHKLHSTFGGRFGNRIDLQSRSKKQIDGEPSPYVELDLEGTVPEWVNPGTYVCRHERCSVPGGGWVTLFEDVHQVTLRIRSTVSPPPRGKQGAEVLGFQFNFGKHGEAACRAARIEKILEDSGLRGLLEGRVALGTPREAALHNKQRAAGRTFAPLAGCYFAPRRRPGRTTVSYHKQVRSVAIKAAGRKESFSAPAAYREGTTTHQKAAGRYVGVGTHGRGGLSPNRPRPAACDHSIARESD